MRTSVERPHATRDLARRFVHTLTPIAFAYVLAHYFSLLVFQGQLSIYLISDPLGDGSNIFGTAGIDINYSLLSDAAIWYVQVAALIVGHVCGPDPRARPRPGDVQRIRGRRSARSTGCCS